MALFEHLFKWDESLVSRGQTGEGTNSGSFAPRDAGQSSTVSGLRETADSLPHTPDTYDPRQPGKTKEEVYAQAREAHAELSAWLDEGKGVASQLGYTNMKGTPSHVATDEYKRPGGMLFIAPMKGEDRAKEKVENDYRGDWSRLKDIVRATIAVDNFRQMGEFLKKMQESGVKIEKVKNRFMNPTKEGMRDILMNVRFSNGHVGELQVHLKPLLVAKNEGHHYYETIRTLEAKNNFADYKTWGNEDRTTFMDLVEKSKRLYHSAWNSVVRSTATDTSNRNMLRSSSLGVTRRGAAATA